jgi:hypothetical protein
LVGDAVKVMGVPSQIVVALAAAETLAVKFGFTVTITVIGVPEHPLAEGVIV